VDFLDGAHSIATLIFVLGSTAVGTRLLWLSTRTRQLPELLLGTSVLFTGGLGYGLLIGAIAIRGGSAPMPPEDVPALAVLLAGVGRALHDFGVTLYLAFMVHVFRRRARWAQALALGGSLLLWAGFLVGVAQDSLRVDRTGSAAWLCEYAVIWSYPIWNAIESLRYYGPMRRRVALGLADPVVANRFLLWGTGSIFAALAIWTASIPFAFSQDARMLTEWTPLVRTLTAILGVASVSCSLLAFLPPRWYRERIAAAAAP
jgi:hypothetical protein